MTPIFSLDRLSPITGQTKFKVKFFLDPLINVTLPRNPIKTMSQSSCNTFLGVRLLKMCKMFSNKTHQIGGNSHRYSRCHITSYQWSQKDMAFLCVPLVFFSQKLGDIVMPLSRVQSSPDKPKYRFSNFQSIKTLMLLQQKSRFSQSWWKFESKTDTPFLDKVLILAGFPHTVHFSTYLNFALSLHNGFTNFCPPPYESFILHCSVICL